MNYDRLLTILLYLSAFNKCKICWLYDDDKFVSNNYLT
jgi:hypothetical protein